VMSERALASPHVNGLNYRLYWRIVFPPTRLLISNLGIVTILLASALEKEPLWP